MLLLRSLLADLELDGKKSHLESDSNCKLELEESTRKTLELSKFE